MGIRSESRGNPNKKMRFSSMQYLVLNSRVLETRRIPHLPALTLEVFEREFKAARTGVVRPSKHKPATHKLKKSWTKLMGRRTWKSPTPEGSHVAVAAWRWLQNYMAGYGMGLPGRCIDSAVFSKFVMPHVLVRHNDDPDRVLASLGNAKWAALGWPAVRAGGSISTSCLRTGRSQQTTSYPDRTLLGSVSVLAYVKVCT